MRDIGSEVHTTGLGLNGTTTTNVVCSAYIWQDYHRSEYTWIKRTGSVYNFMNQWNVPVRLRVIITARQR